MTFQISRKLKPVLFGTGALIIAVASIFAYSSRQTHMFSTSSLLAATIAQPAANRGPKRVKRVLLWPQLQSTLQALGDRFEAVGKERLVLTGTIKRASGKVGEIPMRLTVELPEKFRLEEQLANKVRVTTFDGEKQDGLKRSDENIQGEQDEDELESLIFDGVEHLFSGQMSGLANREIGIYLQANLTAFTNYTGPFYNVYEIIDRITLKPAPRVQRKLYYFNSRTSLPEIIQYQVTRARGNLNVEMQFTGWQSFNGQWIPKSFVRLENSTEVLKLSVNAATVLAAADDGIFTIPGK